MLQVWGTPKLQVVRFVHLCTGFDETAERVRTDDRSSAYDETKEGGEKEETWPEAVPSSRNLGAMPRAVVVTCAALTPVCR